MPLKKQKIVVRKDDDSEIIYYPFFFTTEESAYYFEELKEKTKWRTDSITMYGKTHPLPRLQAWYAEPGLTYMYSRIKLEPEAWYDSLFELKTQIDELSHKGVNSVLMNYYRHGRDYVAWHSDDETELGPTPEIISVSFGASRDFQFRHKTTQEKMTLPLESGSLLIMKGPTQKFWQHQIPKRKRVLDARINLTFRKIIS